jgi:hypothetical protein
LKINHNLLLGGKKIPAIGQSLYSINNFLLSFAGINFLTSSDFRTWFYFSAMYFFTQSICRSTILELFLFGRYSLSEARNRVVLLLVFANLAMASILVIQRINYQNILLSLIALNIILFLDYHRYISIYHERKILLAQDLTWLIVTSLLLALRINEQEYSIFIVYFYICGPILSLSVVGLLSFFNKSNFHFANASSNALQIVTVKYLQKALLMSNLVLYLVNLTILSFIQHSYETQLLLEIRKVIWITSPVTTLTLILWTYLVTNHRKSAIRKVGVRWYLKSIIGLYCVNLFITAIFYAVFLRTSIKSEILAATIIFLLTITIGQLALPQVLKFHKIGSISGIWISSVVGPLLTLFFLALLGSSISIIQYNLVTLGCTFLVWVLILKTSKEFDFGQTSINRAL